MIQEILILTLIFVGIGFFFKYALSGNKMTTCKKCYSIYELEINDGLFCPKCVINVNNMYDLYNP